MNYYYVKISDGDYDFTERNRVTGKEERVMFTTLSQASSRLLAEGFSPNDFEYHVGEQDD